MSRFLRIIGDRAPIPSLSRPAYSALRDCGNVAAETSGQRLAIRPTGSAPQWPHNQGPLVGAWFSITVSFYSERSRLGTPASRSGGCRPRRGSGLGRGAPSPPSLLRIRGGWEGRSRVRARQREDRLGAASRIGAGHILRHEEGSTIGHHVRSQRPNPTLHRPVRLPVSPNSLLPKDPVRSSERAGSGVGDTSDNQPLPGA